MKRIIKQLWCGLWHGHDYTFYREVATLDGHLYCFFYCKNCGKGIIR